MIDLNLPKYPLKIKQDKESIKIFDEIRQKYVILTPEEWVRQNFLHYLIREKNYPKGLIKLEKTLILNNLTKRCDAVVYNTYGKPKMILEFKQPKVKITQKAFDQIGRYNFVLKVPYLVISNGLQHYCLKVDFQSKKIVPLHEIINYNKLK